MVERLNPIRDVMDEVIGDYVEVPKPSRIDYEYASTLLKCVPEFENNEFFKVWHKTLKDKEDKLIEEANPELVQAIKYLRWARLSVEVTKRQLGHLVNQVGPSKTQRERAH